MCTCTLRTHDSIGPYTKTNVTSAVLAWIKHFYMSSATLPFKFMIKTRFSTTSDFYLFQKVIYKDGFDGIRYKRHMPICILFNVLFDVAEILQVRQTYAKIINYLKKKTIIFLKAIRFTFLIRN